METRIEFTTEPIVAPELKLPSREIGAAVEFWGIVREMEGGEALRGLFYEAYESMARRQMRRIFDELGERHGGAKVEFIHRLGWVAVGEPSLYLRVLASHRGEALRFCAEAIDRMKADVPIWKRTEGARREEAGL